MKHKAEYCNGVDWIVCKPLNKECEGIVNDLVNSARITQNWSEEKKEKYFYRAVSIACDMATRKSKSKIRKILDNIIEKISHKLFCIASKLVIYVP